MGLGLRAQDPKVDEAQLGLAEDHLESHACANSCASAPMQDVPVKYRQSLWQQSSAALIQCHEGVYAEQ